MFNSDNLEKVLPLEQNSSSRIRVLSDEVANQIAAGEVVERPASVVKELVENSLDARATEIIVMVANGGRSLISVQDNGCGMSREDALIAIERFGTSKVSALDDLFSIGTLGFRGEALPSIASVSRFCLESASGQGGQGTSVFINGGKLVDVRQISRARGTTVEVKSLFINVPARRKFLRSEATEKGLIKSTLIDLALSRPRIRLRYIHDGQVEMSLNECSGLAERARELRIVDDRLFLKVASSLITESPQGWALEAYLSSPAESLSSSAKLHLMVNGRAVRDPLLLRAIRDGYGTFLKPGQYPQGVLLLTVPPQDVDVNVHPRKAEVRFRQAQDVFNYVSAMVRKQLHKVTPLSAAGRLQADQSRESLSTNGLEEEAFPSARSMVLPLGLNDFFNVADVYSQAEQFPQATHSLQGDVKQESGRLFAEEGVRYLGQVFECYLLFATAEELRILDMHAAHERIRFFQIKQQFAAQGRLPSQLLSSPQVIEVSGEHAENLAAALPIFQQLGIDCDLFGGNAVVVRGTPVWLNNLSPSKLFQELDALPYWGSWQAAFTKSFDEIIARLACHSSIRSGRILEPAEALALLRDLKEVETSGLCPHGRPVMVRIPKTTLERDFSR